MHFFYMILHKNSLFNSNVAGGASQPGVYMIKQSHKTYIMYDMGQGLAHTGQKHLPPFQPQVEENNAVLKHLNAK